MAMNCYAFPRMKKRSVISTVPEVFSLSAKSDYSRFVVRDGASGMMRDTWISIGNRLNTAIHKVGKEANGQAQKTEAA
jgi:hypothetical protein